MINEEATFRWKGYRSTDLPKGSHKKVWRICDGCQKGSYVRYCDSHKLCSSCCRIGKKHHLYGKKRSVETRRKMSENHADFSGDKNPMFGKISPNNGKTVSDATKLKISASTRGEKAYWYGKHHSPKTINKIRSNRGDLSGENNPMHGKKHSETALIRMRKAKKGVYIGKNNPMYGRRGSDAPSWKGGVSFETYCEKFNEGCREHNREKYMRMCFICGKNEVFNGQKLSVHHVDRNKDQGCNDHNWSLVPLCRKHHSTCHNELWESRIMYLLDHVW